MPRSAVGFGSLPLLSLVVACATAVDQGFVDDDTGNTGGSQSSLSGAGGKSGAGASTGGKSSGSGGKSTMAFGGTSSAGTAGRPTGESGSDSGGTDTGGSATGGKASGGTAGSGNGGKAAGGTGGSTAGTGGGGNGGSGGSTTSTGDCAPANSGWVVQYWTNTPAGNMPAGDLRIFNNSGQTVNFTALELRHYFTNEETATLTFIFSTFGHNFPADPYYQDEIGSNVLSSILAVAPAVPNASHYIRIKFNATPGNFGSNEYAQLGFYGSLSMYPMKSNQANDYTYAGHPTNDPGSANKTVGWDHVTLYKDSQLVWGCEP